MEKSSIFPASHLPIVDKHDDLSHRGHHSYVKIGRGVMHEIYWDFANSGRVRLKFGHTKLGREIKTGKLMFSRGNNPLHTHMAATCSKAAGFNLNTSHFVFSNQAYM